MALAVGLRSSPDPRRGAPPGLASWLCLSRLSTRFGASSARKLATEAKNLRICSLLQRAAPMPDLHPGRRGVDGRDEPGRARARRPRLEGAISKARSTVNAKSAAYAVLIVSKLLMIRKKCLTKAKPSLLWQVMNDLGHIGRSGANEERRIASARRGICHCGSVLLNRRQELKIFSGPGGRRKRLNRLKMDKEIQGKPSRFLGLSLPRLGPSWLNLDSAWIRLGPISTCTIRKASMPMAAENRARAMSVTPSSINKLSCSRHPVFRRLAA
jgi:hypothetical protein